MREWIHYHIRKPQSIYVTIILYYPSSFHWFVQLSCILIPKFFNSDSWSKLAWILGVVTESRSPHGHDLKIMYFDRMWWHKNQTTYHFILKPTTEPKDVFWHLGSFLGRVILCRVLGHVGLSWLCFPVGLNGKTQSLAMGKWWCQALLRPSVDFSYTSFPIISRSRGVGRCCLTGWEVHLPECISQHGTVASDLWCDRV